MRPAQRRDFRQGRQHRDLLPLDLLGAPTPDTRRAYRLHVRGLEQVKTMKGPVVVLPNHPGYIDPFLLFGVLWPSLRMRPLVYRGTFQGFTGHLLVRLVNALEVPDLDVASVRPQRGGASRRRHRRRAGAWRTFHSLAGRPCLARRRRANRTRPRRRRHPPVPSREQRGPGAHPRRLGLVVDLGATE